MFIHLRSIFVVLICAAIILYCSVSYTRERSLRNCLDQQRFSRDTLSTLELPIQIGKQASSQQQQSATTLLPDKINTLQNPITTEKQTNGKRKNIERCRRVDHVLFLKTHKTGGSTITNILNRYGDKWNLTFVLPKQRHLFTFLWPTRFRLSYTAPLYKMNANILCNHARYNRKPMHWLFPKNKSKYITILRDPIKQYESVFNFMHFANPLGFNEEKDPLGTFLKYPPSFRDTYPHMKKTLALHLLRNPMMFDLGLDFRYFQNQSAIDNYLNFLDKEFDLVMIMEHFDESLILLKRLMCWSFEEILYFKLNERQDQQKRDNLAEVVKHDIKSWNRADSLLYTYFNQTLWRKIKSQGSAFYRELKIFRRLNARISRKCLEQGSFLDEAYTGVYVKGYSLRNDIPATLKTKCENMKRNEISYVKYFRKKMSDRLLKIEEPEEYLDDPLNDWNLASDFEHVPSTSGYGSADYVGSG
ncbi:galactosylceramide sulfotransferase-like [Actinia tenebrosa]|uniref:Galactosylceramide sulfotransferase-like n=1 Tax=Actinia tenebrosa TaxID=6105 RepID=A0A6P8I907_ACTTE|nr:galactosylceramide sulfotransferase-like [Actinia tenebrosa]